MKKKILSMALACALVLSVTKTVGAAGTELTEADEKGVYSTEVTSEAEVELPVIKITISSGEEKLTKLNPYKLKCTIDSKDYTDQIANAEDNIKNESNVPISVNVAASATTSDAKKVPLSATPLTGKETTKSVFAFLAIKTVDDVSSAAFETAPAYNKAEKGQILFEAKATPKTGVVTLGVGNTTPTYAAYKIFGSVSSTPTEAWNDTDKVTFNVIFSFDPLVVPAES